MPTRLEFETLLEGKEEYVVFAIIPNNEMMGLGPSALGTTLKSHPLVDLQGSWVTFADYVLTGYQRIQTQQGAFVRAIFSKDYNPTVAVFTNYLKKTRDWPAVLDSILLKGLVTGDHECVGDIGTSFMEYIATAIPAIDVGWLRDAWSGPTKLKHEVFFSRQQFDLSGMDFADAPVPRSIHFDRHVVTCSVPPCLHPAVKVRNLHVSQHGGFIAYPPATWDATNKTDWTDFVEDDGGIYTNGVWRRDKITRIAPA